MNIRERRITLGHASIWVAQPGQPEILIDAIDPATFAADERIPYWAHVWPAAVALGRHLLSLDLRGLKVIELGAGVGLASLAAARAGGRVLLTDYEAEALAFARRNAARNELEIELAQLDWRHPHWPAGFHLAIAADILYERRNVAPLIERVPRLLLPGGRAILADPGGVLCQAFVKGIAEEGLEVSTRPTYLFWEGRSYQFELVIARKPGRQ